MNRRSLLLSAILLFAVSPVSAWSADGDRADGDRADVTPSIADLIADLDSDEFAARKTATRKLIDVGGKAVARLTVAAQGGRSEERRVGKERRSRWSPSH